MRCDRCGEERQPEELLEAVHVRTGEVRRACKSSAGTKACSSNLVARIGPRPDAGGAWELREARR